jgi:hypothetical protein
LYNPKFIRKIILVKTYLHWQLVMNCRRFGDHLCLPVPSDPGYGERDGSCMSDVGHCHSLDTTDSLGGCHKLISHQCAVLYSYASTLFTKCQAQGTLMCMHAATRSCKHQYIHVSTFCMNMKSCLHIKGCKHLYTERFGRMMMITISVSKDNINRNLEGFA